MCLSNKVFGSPTKKLQKANFYRLSSMETSSHLSEIQDRGGCCHYEINLNFSHMKPQSIMEDAEAASVPAMLSPAPKPGPKTKLSTFVPSYESTQDLWSKHQYPGRESVAHSLMHTIEKNKASTDLVVVVDNKRFECHRIILQVISKLFREMEPKEEYHISTNVISAHDFGILYRWPFEGKDKDYIGHSSLLNIVKAAEFLGCEYLHQKCWEILETVTEDSFNTMVLCGCPNASAKLNEILMPRVAEVFLQFAASSEFVRLPPLLVRRLFKGHLWVNSELEVLMAAIVWLNYNWPERITHIGLVLEAIRFHEIPFHSLITFAERCDGPPALRAVAQSEDFKKLERLALIKLCSQKSPQKWQGGTESARKLIYDRNAGYHHSLTCRNQKFWPYNMFADYLIFLQTAGKSHVSKLNPCDDPSIVCCPPKEFE